MYVPHNNVERKGPRKFILDRMYLKSSPSPALLAAYRRYRRFAYRYFYAIHLSRACTVIFDARGRKTKIHAYARSRFSPLFRRKRKGKKKARTDSRSIGIGSRRFLRRGSGGIRIRHARLRKRIRCLVRTWLRYSRDLARSRAIAIRFLMRRSAV